MKKLIRYFTIRKRIREEIKQCHENKIIYAVKIRRGDNDYRYLHHGECEKIRVLNEML